jgi:hypothetical protein
MGIWLGVTSSSLFTICIKTAEHLTTSKHVGTCKSRLKFLIDIPRPESGALISK